MNTMGKLPMLKAMLCTLTIVLLVAFTLAIPGMASAKNNRANEPHFKGKVTAVSSTSITIHSKENNADNTFTVSSKTKVTLDNKTVAIGDVAVGMNAAIVSADGKAADVIHAHTAKAGGHQPKS